MWSNACAGGATNRARSLFIGLPGQGCGSINRMPETLTLDRIADLTELDRAELRALSLAVYPPDESRSWAGRDIEWAPAEWCVRVRDANDALVSYVGITLRQAEHDGAPVRVGGIGGVKTHPAARGRGLAARATARAAAFFHDERVGFALLVCAPHLLAYYTRLGWHEFAGRLLVRQRGETVEFTFNRVMTFPITSRAPEGGTIDLVGAPW